MILLQNDYNANAHRFFESNPPYSTILFTTTTATHSIHHSPRAKRADLPPQAATS